jgi:hypothetical protein
VKEVEDERQIGQIKEFVQVKRRCYVMIKKMKDNRNNEKLTDSVSRFFRADLV